MVSNKVEDSVRRIIERVKKDGDRAVMVYTRKFDGINVLPAKFRLTRKEITASVKLVSPEYLSALYKAVQNVWKYHLSQLRVGVVFKRKGVVIEQKFVPIEAVGLYVPGGLYSYPSTVLMTAIPAKVAGVDKVVMVSPSKKLTPEVIAAAYVCGVDEIYRIGGVQAIAALAYGTSTIPKVDKIVGPGNVFVAAAKKVVYGDVGIDMLAGPSEVVVYTDYADDKTVECIAYDLLAQAEHDPAARAVVIATNKKVGKKIATLIPKNNMRQVKIVYAGSINSAAGIINKFAPEHLLILSKSSGELVSKIRNAGAVFVGRYNTVAMGDYVAGPSHVLPTGGSARFDAGLSVDSFVKRIAIIKYEKPGFISDGKIAAVLAGIEGMRYHKKSVEVRFEE
ncbi:MAG: histidinol dehydrogenase [Elusimicrobiota bacterium]